MTPGMAWIIDRLRQWHAEGVNVEPDQYARRLGRVEALVEQLLTELDKEGADDGPAE